MPQSTCVNTAYTLIILIQTVAMYYISTLPKQPQVNKLFIGVLIIANNNNIKNNLNKLIL